MPKQDACILRHSQQTIIRLHLGCFSQVHKHQEFYLCIPTCRQLLIILTRLALLPFPHLEVLVRHMHLMALNLNITEQGVVVARVRSKSKLPACQDRVTSNQVYSACILIFNPSLCDWAEMDSLKDSQRLQKVF